MDKFIKFLIATPLIAMSIYSMAEPLPFQSNQIDFVNQDMRFLANTLEDELHEGIIELELEKTTVIVMLREKNILTILEKIAYHFQERLSRNEIEILIRFNEIIVRQVN